MRYCSQHKQLILICLIVPMLAHADPAGVIKTVSGTVSIQHENTLSQAAPGTELYSTDIVLTGADSSVGITLQDNTLLSAGANSVLELGKFAFDKKTQQGELQASLKRGSLSVISGILAKTSADKVQYSTPKMTLGVRGTKFILVAGERGE